MAAHRTPTSSRPRALAALLGAAVLGATLHNVPAAHAAAATITKVAPIAAAVGNGVTLTGTNLRDVTGVVFLGGEGDLDDVVAPVHQVLTATTLAVQVPQGAVKGPVAVTTDAGTTASTASVTVLRPPAVASLSASTGKGKDKIEIVGTDLGPKPTVTIGGKAAAVQALPAPSSTAVSVLVPAGLPGGATSLVVSTAGGSASTGFYIAPEIKAIAPKVGTTAGGTVAVVTGSGFTGADAVTVGGVAAAFQVVSDKELVLRTPEADASGPAPVLVRTRNGQRTAESAVPVSFGYQQLPAITSLSRGWEAVTVAPSATPAEPVVVHGTNLTHDSVVTLGTTTLTTTVDLAAGTLSFVPPPAPKPVVAKLTVTNTWTATGATVPTISKTATPFAYVAAPAATKLAPVTGPAGTVVTVSGTGFVPGTTARFGATQASCTVVSLVALRCLAPAVEGPLDVTVTTPLGTAPAAPVPALVFTGTAGTAPAAAALAPVTVKALSPAMGLPGTAVSITGANLHTVTAVRFPAASGTVAATELFSVSPGRLVVSVPNGALSGHLQLTPATGAPVTTGVRYLAVARPAVTSLDAVGDATHAVVGGDTVMVRGTGLLAGIVKPVVTVGGVPATVLSSPAPTATAVAIKVPIRLGSRLPVTLSTPFGSSTATLQLIYAPQVKVVKHLVLPDGRRAVSLTGTGFNGAPAVTDPSRLGAVTFDGVPAEQVVVLSDKQLIAVPSPGSSVLGDLLVTTQHSGWQATSAAVTTPLNLPEPTVVDVTPDTAVLGEAPVQVTLVGTNLNAGTVVRFGDADATVVSAAPDGRSMVVVPPVRTTAGTVDVHVTNTIFDQPYTDVLADGFRYMPVPSISGIAPNGGQTGTAPAAVTITGRNLLLNSVVRFGATAATVQGAAEDGTSLTVLPPLSNDSGSVDVTVANIVDGESFEATAQGGYTYSLSPATLTGMSVSTAAPGTTVTLTGTSFVQVSAVRFGTTSVPYTVVNPTTIFVTVPTTPTGSGGTTAAVSVVNGTGTPSSGSFDWTWDARAVVTGLSATTGNQGTRITVTGSGFLGATAVRFGATLGLSPTVVDDSTITVTVPVTAAGGGIADVAVGNGTTWSIEPAVGTANDWTWAPIAAINGLSPNRALPGATVTLTGQNLTGIRTFTIGNTNVTSYTVAAGGTSLTFVVPTNTNNQTTRTVRITNGSGSVNTIGTTGADQFTWG